MTGPSTPAPNADTGAFLSVADIYANARGLGAFLREKSSEIETARKLPPEVAERIRSAGMFRLTMPKSWGGPELSTLEQVEVIEELSKANASVGWCVMIGCDSGLFSGYLDDAAARELYPSLDLATAGHALPIGRADRVEGGFRINGQWPFGSGITHADVVSAGCIIYANGVPEMISERVPRWRLMLAPSSSFEIADTWYTTGLRGTGSNDYRAQDLFIPERHSLSFAEPAKRNAPLWRNSNTILPKMAGVPLGAARAAIDFFRDAMQGKVEVPSMKLYKNLARIQSTIADAEMMLGAARSYVFSSLDRQWERLENAFRCSRRCCDLHPEGPSRSRASRCGHLVPAPRRSAPHPRMGRRVAPQLGREAQPDAVSGFVFHPPVEGGSAAVQPSTKASRSAVS
jgi:alkylation response protein AidB-like acyl-CoA dehydrogenase